MKTNGLSDVSSSEREAEDDQFCGMQYGNTECSDDLLEICMILELILLLVRITCFSGKKKIVTVVAVFVVSFHVHGRSDE